MTRQRAGLNGAPYERTDYKVGSRVVGHIRTYEGAVVYVHRCTYDDLWRDKNGMSDALREHIAAWPLDEGTISMLRVKQIPWVAMAVECLTQRRIIESYYLTETKNYLDTGEAKLWRLHNYRKKHGNFQRWLALENFTERASKVVVGLGA